MSWSRLLIRATILIRWMKWYYFLADQPVEIVTPASASPGRCWQAARRHKLALTVEGILSQGDRRRARPAAQRPVRHRQWIPYRSLPT
jgi:hypothetical protein